jgi:hypothetical protein
MKKNKKAVKLTYQNLDKDIERCCTKTGEVQIQN